jgi:hypothetical protein
MMPMFSADGKSIVYTETPAFDAGAAGHTLIVMDFDVGSKVFSNPRGIFHNDTKFPARTPAIPPSTSPVRSTGAGTSAGPRSLPPCGRTRLAEARTAARRRERQGMTWTSPFASLVLAPAANAEATPP